MKSKQFTKYLNEQIEYYSREVTNLHVAKSQDQRYVNYIVGKFHAYLSVRSAMKELE